MKYKAVVLGGEINFFKDKDYIDRAKKLEGETIYVELKKQSKCRSTVQNNYWHGIVCKILSDELGYTVEEIHEYLKLRFLSEKKFDDKISFLKIGSTASLSTVDFERLINKVRMWSSSELGCYIPKPNEKDLINKV